MENGGMHLCLVKENCQEDTYTVELVSTDNIDEVILIMADDYIPIVNKM